MVNKIPYQIPKCSPFPKIGKKVYIKEDLGSRFNCCGGGWFVWVRYCQFYSYANIPIMNVAAPNGITIVQTRRSARARDSRK